MEAEILRLKVSPMINKKKENAGLIQRLLVPVPPVGPEAPCEEVYRLFAEDKALQSIAVVEDEKPVGLVNRYALVDRFSRRYFRDLYALKPIHLIMEKNPLIVDRTVSLDNLSAIVADEEERYLYEGFIITEEGKYRGIGTGQRLIKEIMEQKQADLYHLAHHDALTGLPNRLLFYDRLSQALAQAQRNVKRLGVLFIDLDHFKNVNDSLGHGAGDNLLRETALRISGCLREGDTVARLGGDEFTVILTDIANPADAALVGKKIMETMVQPFSLSGNEVRVSCSIGASLFPDDGADMETLVKNADTAVYRSKKTRNCFSYFGTDVRQEKAGQT